MRPKCGPSLLHKVSVVQKSPPNINYTPQPTFPLVTLKSLTLLHDKCKQLDVNFELSLLRKNALRKALIEINNGTNKIISILCRVDRKQVSR